MPVTASNNDGGDNPVQPGAGLDGCEIHVDHIGAQIRSEPSHSSATLGSVPSGIYTPLDTALSNWAGMDERWYRLDVDGRVGWLVATPIFVVSQSGTCP